MATGSNSLKTEEIEQIEGLSPNEKEALLKVMERAKVSVYMYMYMSVYQCVCVCVCVCVSVCLSVCLFFCLSVCLCVCK